MATVSCCKTNPLLIRDWFLQRAISVFSGFSKGIVMAFCLNKERRLPIKPSAGHLFACLLFSGGLFLSGCGSKEMPKPYAYARLEYPTSSYRMFQLPGHPCRFDYPDFFTVSEKPSGKPGTRWVDLRWPAYGATVFTTYRHLDSTIPADELAAQMEQLLTEKLPEHTSVNARLITHPKKNWRAYVFEVEGSTSIPLEFLIADDQQHLFQGIVQFDQVVNRDSLEDILDGLSVDVNHLIHSFTFTSTP